MSNVNGGPGMHVAKNRWTLGAQAVGRAVTACVVGASAFALAGCGQGSSTAATPVELEGVVADLKAAGLPAANARDTTSGCRKDLGCLQRVTTDDVTLLTFSDASDRDAYLAAFGEDAEVIGDVVLSYAAARTPMADRDRYEEAARAANTRG